MRNIIYLFRVKNVVINESEGNPHLNDKYKLYCIKKFDNFSTLSRNPNLKTAIPSRMIPAKKVSKIAALGSLGLSG